MQRNHYTKRLLLTLSFVGSLLLTACIDDKYDFNEVDLTIGLGGNNLSIPTSSTDTIKLADVLDLDDVDWVVIKPNGDYVFEMIGDDVDPIHPEVDKVYLKKQTTAYDLVISLSSDEDDDEDEAGGTKSSVEDILASGIVSQEELDDLLTSSGLTKRR